VLAEIFPSNIRGKAMGIATMVNRGTSFVVAYTFLTMCERLEWSGTFYLYAAMAGTAIVSIAPYLHVAFAGERAARRGAGIMVPPRPRLAANLTLTPPPLSWQLRRSCSTASSCPRRRACGSRRSRHSSVTPRPWSGATSAACARWWGDPSVRPGLDPDESDQKRLKPAIFHPPRKASLR
jgi:hypothetical protein